MSSQADQDDPEVQKNGFRAILDAVNVDPEALEGTEGDSFFRDHFDPDATFDENLSTFRGWLANISSLEPDEVEAIEESLDG